MYAPILTIIVHAMGGDPIELAVQVSAAQSVSQRDKLGPRANSLGLFISPLDGFCEPACFC